MWKFNPFGQKEQAGLEGRIIDVGNVKVNVRNAIAEGGFSCVYLSRDALHPSKQYALKHMISNDAESLELVMKEISVMKLFKGHPNIVTLVAHSIIDMGRTKEAFLVMEFCEKSLVGVLDGRGAGYFEEKQILLIFRDVCNAVFAMHNQSPPIAHRDIKVENVLLGSDGTWKLCDFGSTSTNHKRFDRPEEMGIEEDNIRKYTTPAYRAPEMWDLYRKEVISEKVDIWALGCLLYRLCYFKSAFDGESKLQILNGNYKIPESPKYKTTITGLINDMLHGSPDARPDITQIWFRVNEQLCLESQKDLPDSSPSSDVRPLSDSNNEGGTKTTARAGNSKKVPNPMPRRSPPPPPKEQARNVSPHSAKDASKISGSSAPIGSFWSSQHVQESHVVEEKAPVFDEEPTRQTTAAHNQNSRDARVSPAREHIKIGQPARSTHGKPTGDIEINFFPKSSDQFPEMLKPSLQDQNKVAFQNEAFNSFVADFDTSKFNPTNPPSTAKTKSPVKEDGEEQVGRLEEQLKQVNMEKADILSKYEKLSAICRSQRQEIQELKQALAAATSSAASVDNSKSHPFPGGMQPTTPPREKIEGTVWELQEGMFAANSATPNPDPKPWQAFANEPKPQPAVAVASGRPKSVRTTNGRQNSTRQQASAKDTWGFDQDDFSAAAPPRAPLLSQNSPSTQGMRSMSGRFTSIEIKKADAEKPAGWADF